MRTSTTYGGLLTAALAAVIAAAPAHADSSQGGRGNMPASATPSTTTQSDAASRRPNPAVPRSRAHAPGAQPNMPAASSATTTARPRLSEELTPEAAPVDRALPTPDTFEQGTILDLDEMAPVEVIDLQQRLKAMSLYQGDVDGIAGPQTRRALHQYFVKQAQLALEGKLNASAIALLSVTPKAPKTL